MKLMNILAGIMLSSVFTICLRSQPIVEINLSDIAAQSRRLGGQCKSKTTGALSPMISGVCPAGTEMVDASGRPIQMSIDKDKAGLTH
jgi:hypothetical protein